MRWKRAITLLLSISMLLCLCACGDQTGGENQNQQDTQQDVSGTSKEEPDETGAPIEETAPAVSPADHGDAQTLSLQKKLYSMDDWDGNRLLVQSEFSHVTLREEDAEKYQELAQALEQTAAMIKKSMEEEYDNFCTSAREDLPWTGRAIWVSTLDIQVRRADSVVISLLSDSYSDYGFIEDFRGMYGTTYDAHTGRELALNDVVDINNDLADAVAKELNSHMLAGDFDYQDTVKTYFANTPYDDLNWTLDYNGVTFYFGNGDLAEPGEGRQTATVSFAEYPKLFKEKYMAVPTAYMVELPIDSPFFTDLDGDGDLEELNISGIYDSDTESYTQCGIYTDTAGRYHYEDCAARGFMPYYVKAANGKHYVYLFCKQYEGGPVLTFALKVYDVSGGKVTSVGKMNAGLGYIPVDTYAVPTDPGNFYLDDYDAMVQDFYAVGAKGLPELK